MNALQTGLLRELEAQPSQLIYLDESLHAKAFAGEFAGWQWVLDQPESDSDAVTKASRQNDLPPALATLLATLNATQKAYDQARLGLVIRRRQLFMDWYRYVKLQVSSGTDPNVDLGTLEGFLQSGGNCELTEVVQAGTASGLLQFTYDSQSGNVTSIGLAPGSAGLAASTVAAYNALIAALALFPGWTLQAHGAPKFYTPTDPVVLAEGPGLVPAQRNGNAAQLPVRLSLMLPTQLQLTAGAASFTVPAASLPGLPVITTTTPNATDVQALVAESLLLIPMAATVVGAALASQGGTGNPAVTGLAAFLATLNSVQGGLSPLEGGPGQGLYALTRSPAWTPVPDPSVTATDGSGLVFVWSNAASNAWVSDPVGWNAQTYYPELDATRVDPFLPLYYVWTATLAPLQWGNGQAYTANNLTQYFQLNADDTDYTYATPSGVAPNFTAPNSVTYTGSAILSTRAAYSLATQIDAYLTQYPGDPAADELKAIRAAYLERNFVSQALDGFSLTQTLSTVVPQITVENLSSQTGGVRDRITSSIQAAAAPTSNVDDWYDQSFNSLAPVFAGLQASDNFGPLRAGFMEVNALEVVDVFGQRMNLTTKTLTTDGSLQPVVAMSLQPPSTDSANAGKVFLPPRLLMPLRLWFQFLAASDALGSDAALEPTGLKAREVLLTNSHAASTPIFGWLVPNHLEQSLFFYDADGSAIGSFFVRAGAIAYQTRPGNTLNPTSTLQKDLVGANPHLAALMEFIDAQSGGFLTDLMTAIQDSETLIQPSSASQDLSLAVLIGRPLALTRCTLAMETNGGLLPVSQADTSAGSAFPTAVNGGLVAYEDRQKACSANVQAVELPIRMGALANVDDGLVCFLPEIAGSSPYTMVYAPTAPSAGANGVQQPAATTTQLTLNGDAIDMTLLMDPRASVHATTGVLPVSTLEIDPDQYQLALSNIAMTFFTAPMLSAQTGFIVPVPQETGYSWDWITFGEDQPQPLKANAANGNAVFGYSPQTLVEGWLDLVPIPPKSEETLL